jgi:hypothetical protein
VPSLTYADLVDLTDSSSFVVRAEIRDAILLPAARAPDVKPGMAGSMSRRFLWKGCAVSRRRCRSALSGRCAAGGQRQVAALQEAAGSAVRSRPKGSADIQLVAPDAQLVWGSDLDARVRSLISELGAGRCARA